MTYVDPDQPDQPTPTPESDQPESDQPENEEKRDAGDGPSSHETSGQFPADEVASTRESDESPSS